MNKKDKHKNRKGVLDKQTLTRPNKGSYIKNRRNEYMMSFPSGIVQYCWYLLLDDWKFQRYQIFQVFTTVIATKPNSCKPIIFPNIYVFSYKRL